MNKGGLSQVVTTVLIILIVLAAIVILWLSLRNSLQDSVNSIGTERFTVKIDIVDDTISYSGCNVELDVQRPAGSGEIAFLRFVLTSSSGETQVIDHPPDGFVLGQFQELETLHVMFECDLPDLETISVYPVFANNNIGDNSDTANFPYIPQCSDGFDNDGDESIDYPADAGCYSPEDDDERKAFDINLASPGNGVNYQVSEDSPDLLLEFNVNPGDYDSDLSLESVINMWYNLTKPDGTVVSHIISLDDLSEPNQGSGLNLNQLEGVMIEQEGAYDINVSVQHENGDISVSQTNSFVVEFSEIVIQAPVEGGFYALIDSIALSFTIDDFTPTSCWYTLDDGDDISLASCDEGQNNYLIVVPEGSYTLKLFSKDSNQETINADVNFVANMCPADLNGDDAINTNDLNDILNNWGICEDINNCPGDVNGDGFVDGFDLDLVIQFWTGNGNCTNPQNPFPQ